MKSTNTSGPKIFIDFHPKSTSLSKHHIFQTSPPVPCTPSMLQKPCVFVHQKNPSNITNCALHRSFRKSLAKSVPELRMSCPIYLGEQKNYTPGASNIAGWKMEHLKMYLPLKMVIFQPAMLVYQKVLQFPPSPGFEMFFTRKSFFSPSPSHKISIGVINPSKRCLYNWGLTWNENGSTSSRQISYSLDLPPHPVTGANEGLGWDSLLKM